MCVGNVPRTSHQELGEYGEASSRDCPPQGAASAQESVFAASVEACYQHVHLIAGLGWPSRQAPKP
jgi:hypothetical protein